MSRTQFVESAKAAVADIKDGATVMIGGFGTAGQPVELVSECNMPLTGVGCVSRVYTDHAVFLIEPEGVGVLDLFGISLSDLPDLVEVSLTDRIDTG